MSDTFSYIGPMGAAGKATLSASVDLAPLVEAIKTKAAPTVNVAAAIPEIHVAPEVKIDVPPAHVDIKLPDNPVTVNLPEMTPNIHIHEQNYKKELLALVLILLADLALKIYTSI